MRLIDERIAAQAARGDRKALEQLCAVTWRQLYQFVYHKVQNREEAEDVTQETYSRALRAQPAGYSAGQFMVYLQTVALNLIRDRWRKAQTRGRVEARFSPDLAEPALTEPDAAEGVIARECVARALGRLGEEYRQVLELRILKGFSTAETAKRMGRTEAAIRTLQYRAILALKEELR